MFILKKSFIFITIIVFIFGILCIQTVPRIKYHSQIKMANIVELEALTKQYPLYPEAYIILGEKYSSKMPEKSAYYYEKAAEIVKDDRFCAAMDEYIASSYIKNGNVVAAIKYYSNPILVKYNLTTNILLANILRTMGRYDEAMYVLNSFEKNDFLSIASAEPDMFSRLRLEFLYNILSKFDDGIYAKNMILHAKAIVLYEKGDYEKALEISNEYMNSSNQIPVSLFLRIYTAMGDLKNAEKYSKLLDKYKKSKNFMDNYSQGLYYISLQNYSEAESIFTSISNNESYKFSSDNNVKQLYSMLGLGILNIEKQNYKDAIKYLQKAVDIRPYSYFTTVKLAECYKKTDDLKNYNKYNLKIKALLSY